ncbi:GNAT family N-acetyltransferase [soil metagenome]
MTDPFSLRRLGVVDLDHAAALHAAAFTPLGEPAWTRHDLASLLASPGVAGILLQAGDRDVGFALCRVTVDEAELLTIAVQSGQRRQGAGRRLLQSVIDHARHAGAATLFLEVGVDNPAAKSLYDLQGFATVGRRVAYYRRGDGPPADGLVMRLTLS